jgi:uncharacterized protein
MLRTRFIYIPGFLLWFVPALVWGQSVSHQKTNIGRLPSTPPGKVKPQIALLASAADNSIRLRWAVTTPSLWKTANRYGYTLERYTISRSGKPLPAAEKKLLASGVRPRPLPDWQALATREDYAAVLAQALYGNSFEVSAGSDSSSSKAKQPLTNLSREADQRYGLAMYAADLCYPAACMAALGYTDSSVKAGEQYLYRLYLKAPASLHITDTAFLLTSMDSKTPLPPVEEPLAAFGDKSVTLSWDVAALTKHYSGYYVERSTDSLHYERLNAQPLNYVKNTGRPPASENEAAQRLYYSDSLADNQLLYYYRVRGINPFGDLSPASAVVSGRGMMQLAYTPGITHIGFDPKGILTLHWDFDPAGDSLISGFTLHFGKSADGSFSPVAQGIAPASRQFSYDTKGATGYFIIEALAKQGDSRRSFPYLVQSEDSTAPAMPQGLRAVIDTSGIVTLQWKANTEKDLAGYKLYKTYLKGQEYTTITDTLLTATVFRDTLALRSLNRKVWYSLRALDGHANPSDFTPAVEITKPDRVAPSAPVFTDYTLTEKGIELHWVNSPDSDVIAHILYRRILTDTLTAWEAVADWKKAVIPAVKKKKPTPELTLPDNRYTDTKLSSGQGYAYTLVAVDSSGLRSIPAEPLQVKAMLPAAPKAITKLEAAADREQRSITLSWQVNAAGITEYEIFRAADKEKPALYKTLPAGVVMLTDKEIQVNITYTYALRALYDNGRYSEMKKITIVY